MWKKHKKHITERIKDLFKACFEVVISQQNSTWVPHIICAKCYEMLDKFDKTGSKSKIKFLKPAIWKKPLDKSDCYFCMTNVTGVNKVRPDKILYATVCSVVRPQKQIVESLIDEASRDSFIQGMNGMQVACGTEEDVENLNHHTDDDTDKNESLTEAESESVESEEELSSDSDEEYVPISKEKSQKRSLKLNLMTCLGILD